MPFNLCYKSANQYGGDGGERGEEREEGGRVNFFVASSCYCSHDIPICLMFNLVVRSLIFPSIQSVLVGRNTRRVGLPVLQHVKTKMMYFDLAPCSVSKVSRQFKELEVKLV